MGDKIEYDIRFRHPSTIVLYGGSKSGKTTWVKKCLQNAKDLFTVPPTHVVYYYAAWQDLYDDMKREGLVQEWRNECPQKEYIQQKGDELKAKGEALLVVVDDMLSQMSKDIADLFQITSHHSGASIIFLSQSIFFDNKNFREMKGSTNYVVLFKNTSDKQQVKTFLSRVSDHPKALLQVYHKVTRQPYTYLLIDQHQETPDEIRVRTHIFPTDSQKHGIKGTVQVFVPPLV
jgi:hypothetical protein